MKKLGITILYVAFFAIMALLTACAASAQIEVTPQTETPTQTESTTQSETPVSVVQTVAQPVVDLPPFSVPPFDAQSIATEADMYLSNMTFGTSQEEVFKTLGEPLKKLDSYDDGIGTFDVYQLQEGLVTIESRVENGQVTQAFASQLMITDPNIIGPRGLCVGDPVNKILEVFPGRNDIVFDQLKEETAIYSEHGDNPTNSCRIYPKLDQAKANSGEIDINIDWYMGIIILYKEGIITEIRLNQMLD